MSSVSSLDGATAELLDGRHGTKQKAKPHHRVLPHRAESSSFDSGDSSNSNGLVNGCSEAESLEETSLFTVQKPSPVSLAASYDSGMGSMVSSMTAAEHDCDLASAVVARDVYDVASFDAGGKKCKSVVLKGVVDEAGITKLDFNTPNVRDKELHEASLTADVKDVVHCDDANKCTATRVSAASLSNSVDSDQTSCDLSASVIEPSDTALQKSQIPKSQGELCGESNRSTGSHEHIVISVPARVDNAGVNIAPVVPPRPPLRTSFREKKDPSDDSACFAGDANASNSFPSLADNMLVVNAIQPAESLPTTAEFHNADVPPRPPSRPSATKSPRTVLEHNRQTSTPSASHNADASTSYIQPPPLPRRSATHHHRDPPPLPSRKNELSKRHAKSPDPAVRCPDGHVCTVTFRQPDGFVIPVEASSTTDKDNDPPVVPPKRVHSNRVLVDSSRNNNTEADREAEPIHVPVSEIASLLESPQLLPRRAHSPPITRRVRTEVPARRSNTMMLPLSGAIPHSTVPPVAQQDRLAMTTVPAARHQQQQQATAVSSSQSSTKQRFSLMDNIRHTVVNFFNPHDFQHGGARRKTKSKHEFPDLPRIEATPNEYEKWGPRPVASDNLMSVFIRPPPPIPLRRVDVALEGGSTLSTPFAASENDTLVTPTDQDSQYLRTTDSSCTPVVTPTSSTSDPPLPVPPRPTTERHSPVSRPGSALDGARNSADQHNASTLAAFADTLSQLKDYGWYWGPMSFEEAENKLRNVPDGSFLVRDSSNDRYILSLTFRAEGRTRHTRIEYHKGRFGFGEIENSFGFGSVVDLIENTVDESLKGNYCFFLRHPVHGRPPTRVLLTSPVSRFATMRSLQHMCRFVILRSTRFDHIDCLPLPTRLKHYLKDPHYYAEQQ